MQRLRAEGRHVAMSSAWMTLVKGDRCAVLRARATFTATVRNMKQTLAFAFLYNAHEPLDEGVLKPVLGLLLSPMVAALAMSQISASMITNALVLAKLPLPQS